MEYVISWSTVTYTKIVPNIMWGHIYRNAEIIKYVYTISNAEQELQSVNG